MASSGSWSRSHNNHVSNLSSSQQTALPLPKSVKGNRSFANLAKLFGINSSYRDHHSDAEEDEEEEVGEAEDAEDAIDEDSLMWDAQTALIAHQPSIAMQHYTIAALPPHRSAGACLALGNLLTRGSGLIRRESASNEPLSPIADDHNLNKSATTRFREFVFRSPPISPPTESTAQTVKPVAVGWAIPTDGKRAVRDVDGMGVAGGWLVLGLGWLVEEEMAKSRINSRKSSNQDTASDDDPVSFVTGSRNDRDSTPSTRASSRQGSISALDSSIVASNDSSEATESTLLKTPFDDDRSTPRGAGSGDRSEHDQLKLFYELLSPLVSLYRHGQIQAHDPVSLPPISSNQLPACLQPQGDHQKRRNAWNLGGVVVEAIHDLDILQTGSLGKGKGKEHRKTEQLRIGVAVMVNYLLGMTGSEAESQVHFRQVVHLGQTGMEAVDELVRQAAARLDIILRSPPPTATPLSPHSEYPFPHMQPPTLARQYNHNRAPSTASRFSIMSTMSARLQPSGKSTVSLASMFLDGQTATRERSASRSSESVAVSSLRRIRASSTQPAEVRTQTWWPKLSGWSMGSSATSVSESDIAESEDEDPENMEQESSPVQTRTKPYPNRAQDIFESPGVLPPPDINTIAPTPHASRDSTLETPKVPKPRRRLPFEPSESDSICTIDPELAAAELRSALTKHVVCGVCGVKGLNFPECPRCSLTFCSRACRVDEKKAGNGKRHVCGAWESRKLLTVPVPTPKVRRKSNAARLSQSIKA